LNGLNKFVINFVLPIVVLFLAFRVSYILAIILIVGFILYGLFRSRSDIYANIGNVQYMKGKEDIAYKWMGRAVKVKDSKPNYKIAYALLKLKNDEIDEAERLLQNVVDSNAAADDKNKAKTTMGLVHWKKGRLYFAINSLEQIYADYKNTVLYGYLGFFYILKGDLERALEFNKEAYEYNSTNQLIINNLAHTNLLIGNYNEAENLYKGLMERNPSFLEAYYYYGLVKVNQGDKEEGLNLIKKSLGYKNSILASAAVEEVNEKIAQLNN
jgi:tetratricopeptide (TPR) repeat protein